jgi:glycolate oxidase
VPGFVARGSGTSLSGGSLPVETVRLCYRLGDGIVIALNRLNRILRLDPAAAHRGRRTGRDQPGRVAAAAPHGLYYAPDPSSQSICTIGGNVAFNSGGAHCLKYGMTANHVLGLKAVLPTARWWTWRRQPGAASGPIGAGLFVGSRGCSASRWR